MSIGSKVEMYCKTAKSSTFTKIGYAAQAVKKLVMTCPVISYSRGGFDDNWIKYTTIKPIVCNCDATAEYGAWYLTSDLWVEEGQRNTVLILVLPTDSRLGFHEWYIKNTTTQKITTLGEAFNEIKNYNANTKHIDGWNSMVKWFTDKLGDLAVLTEYLDVQLIDKTGHSYASKRATNYGTGSNTKTVEYWLDWVYSSISDDARNNSTMDKWYHEDINSYVITTVFTVNTISLTIDIKITI